MRKLLHNLFRKAEYFLENLLAFISVPDCSSCGVTLENPRLPLCDVCDNDLRKIFPGDGPVCLICRCPVPQGCHCHDDKPLPIPQLFYWGKYNDLVRELIHRFKFERQYKIGWYLTEIALDTLYERIYNKALDYVIPVPMLKKDKKMRGFNQTELIASLVSQKLNMPVESELLKKIKKTEPQSKLGADERWQNVKDAFAVDNGEKLKGCSLLLVDDIVTTGATSWESTKALYKAGAKNVTVFSLISNSISDPEVLYGTF
jgi:competence protein ComFC